MTAGHTNSGEQNANANVPPTDERFAYVVKRIAQNATDAATRERFVTGLMRCLNVIQGRDTALPDGFMTDERFRHPAEYSFEIHFLHEIPGDDALAEMIEEANGARMVDDPDPYWDDRHAGWGDLCAMEATLPPPIPTWAELMEQERAAMPPPNPEFLALWNSRPRDIFKTLFPEGREGMIRDACEAILDDPDARLAERQAAATHLGRKLLLLTPGDCEAAGGREPLVKGLFARGDFVCVIGAPGSGKSVVVPHMAYCVAQGVDTFGRKVRQADVFYVAAEDVHGMRQRTRALKLSRADAKGFRVVDGLSSLLDTEQRKELLALIARHRPGLIVVDTLAAAFPGINENESRDMSQVVAVMRALTRHGACAILVHHVTKSDDATPRGHSVLNGALDVSLHLGAKDNAGIVRGKLIKNRNGPCEANIAFQIDGFRIGSDEDGEDITAPICREVADAGKPAKLPTKTKAVHDIAAAMIAAGDGQSTTRDALREACIADDRICSEDNRKTRQTAFRRHYEAALAARVLQQDGDKVFLWPVATGVQPEFPAIPSNPDDIPT